MPKITFKSKMKYFEIPSGTELLKAYEMNHEIPLRFGCTQGDCGVCAIKILEGGENLSKCSRHEKQTLKQRELGEGCRLACQCAINGDVVIE
jgi:ferredoxin